MKTLLAGTAALFLAGSAAQASVIDWTTWGTPTNTPNGTVKGTSGTIGVTYTGEIQSIQPGVIYQTPSGTFSGGNVGNAPPDGITTIQLFGGSATAIDTITFGTPVVNPVFAIWSLGSPGNTAAFDFIGSPVFSIQSGGPSAQFLGTSIVQTGSNVTGAEGNGTIQFNGTFTSISWTNPDYENWYGFQVGTVEAAVPEPSTWAMMILGFLGLGVMARRSSLRFA